MRDIFEVPKLSHVTWLGPIWAGHWREVLCCKTHHQLQFGFAFIMYVLHVQSLVRRMVWKHHFTPSSHDLRQQNCLPVPSSGHPWPRHHAVSRDWICSAAVPIIWYPQPHRNQLHKNSSRHPQSLPRKLNYIHKTRSWSRCKSYLSVRAVEAELWWWCVMRCNRSPSIHIPQSTAPKPRKLFRDIGNRLRKLVNISTSK